MIERANAASAQRGDIVLVARDGRLFAHRLLKTPGLSQSSGILTQGDSMPIPDPPIDEDKRLGRVTYIVRGGKSIEPRTTLRFAEPAIATLAQRSEIAARMVVGVHGLRRPAANQNPINKVER